MPAATATLDCYCIHCKGKSAMKDYEISEMKNKRHIAKGKCIKCGKNVAKILSKKEAGL